MLSRQHNFYQQLCQIFDAFLIGLALWLAHAIRLFFLKDFTFFEGYPIATQFANCYWMIALAFPLGPMTLEYIGLYQTHPPLRVVDIVWRSFRGLFFVLIVIFTCVVILRIDEGTISRAALVIFLFLGSALVSIRAIIFQFWLTRRGAVAHMRNFILLCGNNAERQRWKERFLSQPGRNFEIKAEFDLREEGLSRFIQMLHDETVNIVVFSLDERIIPQVREALLACEAEGVEAWVSADFIQTLFTRVQFDKFAGNPLLIYRTTPALSWELLTKRCIDAITSAILLILTSPAMLLVALCIRLTSKGPIIFSQSRSGLHGRPFRMYKFRTMVTNAEQARVELEDRNEMTGPVFKVKNDPRITPFGQLLRKTSLDELPQLWNVLRGEMSMVGPRPLPLYETANFGDVTQRRRMSVRPGLTCLWQVRGRNKITDFKDWVRLDLKYIDQWSLWLDIKILFRTVPVVLLGWGAK